MAGEWRAVQDASNSIQVYGCGDEEVVTLVTDSEEVTDEMRATAALIVTAVNGCISTNYDNPLAVATGLQAMYAILKEIQAMMKMPFETYEDFEPVAREKLAKVDEVLAAIEAKEAARGL